MTRPSPPVFVYSLPVFYSTLVDQAVLLTYRIKIGLELMPTRVAPMRLILILEKRPAV